jgi:predicted nucleic acid-binding protein
MINLANYDKKYNTNLQSDVENVQRQAKAFNAFEGEQRLRLVAMNFFKLSVEQAYTLLNPEAFRREVEEHQLYKKLSKRLQFGRITLGLAPLIVTWSSLSWAVLEYGLYVNAHQSDQQQVLSFLQLWQNGFPGDSLTFFWTGIIDVLLLLSFLGFNIWALVLEHQARSKSEEFARSLQQATDGLMEAVLREGLSDVSSDVQIQRIVRFIKDAIAESYEDLGEIIESAKDTIITSGQEMRDSFDLQIKPLLVSFDTHVQEFHKDLTLLNGKVVDLSQASQSMAGSAGTMAASSGSLASNIQVQTGINKDIDSHIVSLNNTEQRMTTTIAQAEGAVALEVRKAADDMKQAAEKLENAVGKVEVVGRQLTSITPSDLQRITNSANKFADQANQAATQLQNAAQALDTAAKSTRRRKWFF